MFKTMKKRGFLLIIFLFLFFVFTQGEAGEIKEYSIKDSPSSRKNPQELKAGLKTIVPLKFESFLQLSPAEKQELKAKIAPRFFSVLKKGRISPNFPGVNKKKETISLIVRLKEGAEKRDIEAEGIKVRTKTGNIATVTVKLSELNRFVQNKNILYIEPVKRLNLLNNILTGSSIALFGFSTLDDGSEDNYTLSAKSGENLLIRACPGAYGLDPYLQLKDSSGNILAFDDNSGPGNSAEINWTFSSSENYLIVVKSVNPSGSSVLVQDYQLLLSSDNTKLNLFDISGGNLGTAFHLGSNGKLFSNKGAGTIVGIVDTGIDYKHEDFIDDTTGKSRILYIWDQTLTAQGGEVVPAAGYGVEYNQAQINDEIDGTLTGFVREEDTNGHGTHVAGIAAGDGSATNGDEPAGKYKGMAPEAELIIVKTDLTSDHIIDGVNYIFDKASFLGKPAVVNLSLGTHQSPHDGTGSVSYAIDESIETAGSETKGRVVVVAAGNEGSDKIHAEANISPGSPETIKFFNNYGYLGMDIWHDGADKYQVTFSPPSDSTLQNWEWGAPISGPNAAYSGSNCWGTKLIGDYQNNLTINLENPSIDLSGTVNPILTFEHWYKTEENWDGGVVKVSIDNGITWKKIYPEENGGDYPGYDVVDQEIYNASGYEIAKDGAYSGDSTGWVPATFDLSNFAGETIIIKWTFHSDSNTIEAGWFIDDVEVKDGVTTILSEDFEADDGGFTPTINNSLIAEPGTNDWEWLGDENGGVLYEDYVLHDNYIGCNNDYEILIYNSCRNRATWQMSFQRTEAIGDGHLDAWMFGGGGRFSDHISFAKTVCEPGTANSVITAGAYATKYMWDATDGNTYYSPSAISNFGGIAYFSSLGPTRDGRMKPDIVAPGFSVCSSLSSDIDFTDTDISVSYPGGVSPDDRHCLMAGTSMGSPAVAGATALLLSAENKTASEIKVQLQLLAASSPDKFTPSTEIPNNTYGYGKLTLVAEGTEPEPSSGGGGGGCFIATAAFGTPMAKEVRTLCRFRDDVLLKTIAGRNFVKLYYTASPPIADFIRNKPLLKAMVRTGLKPLVWWSRFLLSQE